MADFESTGGIDPAAFASDMFPSTETKEPSSDEGGERAVSSSSPSESDEGSPSTEVTDVVAKEPTKAAEGAAEAAGMSQESYEALPKSWRKEMEADWKLATPALRKYAHEREQQVTQGISGYRKGSDSWNAVMAPFQEVIKQYPDVNVSEILQTLTANHIRMIQATPAERRTHALALARGYGVDLSASLPGGDSPQGISPEMQAYIDARLEPVQAVARDAQGRYMRANEESANREVDAFFSDPKNEFVNELGNDILQIMQKGQAQSLPEAYEIAVLRNPTVKAKYLAQLVAKSTPPPSTASQLPNVKSSATPKSSGKPRTIDDTVDSIVAKHYGR